MRTIFICKNTYYKQVVSNNLQQLSEKDSIAFFSSYTQAENFINNNVVTNKLPIDLIISENNIQGRQATEFYRRITNNQNRTYSNNDFNFYKIPMILLVDPGENKSAYKRYGFADVIDNIGLDRLHVFIQDFVGAVKTWRINVIDELDNLGIKFNSGIIDYTYYFSSMRSRNIHTNILSENFKQFPRRLNYDWLRNNEQQIEIAIDGFKKELRRATRLDKKKEEKRFHSLFNKYPFLIKRDNYSDHWYEPRLQYSDKKYYEPDYGLKPNFQQRTDLSILEVKLPTQGFIKQTKFHPDLYSNLHHHIAQVNDYKDYLESDEYKSIIIEIFGFAPNSIDYNLLVGRLEDKITNLSIFNKRIEERNALNINFITYDELLGHQEKYLERMNKLNIW